MKKTIAILLLLCGAAALAAQTTGPTLSANAQASSTACVAMGGLKPFCDQKALLEELVITAQSAYQSTVSAEFTADEARLTKLEQAAPTPGPQGIPGPAGLSAPHELMLVIPYGSTGFSITTLGALSEYPPVQRTRRIVDFTNVKQLRLCANIISPGGAGSFFQLEAGPAWTVLTGQFSMTAAGLSCSSWQNYSGPLGDQMVRISAAGSNSVTLDFISVQFK